MGYGISEEYQGKMGQLADLSRQAEQRLPSKERSPRRGLIGRLWREEPTLAPREPGRAHG